MSEPVAAGRPAVLVSLIAAATLGMLASTIYVPSVPAIARGLGCTPARVQLTFVGYLSAFAIGMLVLGPLSDRYGRRRTLIAGLALSTLASLGCAASPTIAFLIAARVAQGIGACAGMVVGRAVIRDLYDRDGAAKVISALAIVATLVQSFAPIPGGYLQEWIGWRANFVAVAVYAAFGLVLAICWVSETRVAPVSARKPARAVASQMLPIYQQLALSRRFMGYALVATGAHAGFHIFTAGAPAVLIGRYGILPETYGFYASLPPIGFLAGSFLSNRLNRRLGIDNLIAIGGGVLVPAGLAMVGLALLHVTGPYAVVGPMIFVCCASGLITPNAVAGSLGVNAANVGAASGLASFLQMAGAAGATAALSLGSGRSPAWLAVVTASAGLFAIAAYGTLMQPGSRRLKADIGAPV
ncbi:MAG TPA: multidrug effflux MFS transporter [Stellaceae bacterium]